MPLSSIAHIEVQSAPLDSLHPIGSRTYKQAIDLLQKEIDRTAAKWEPVITAAPPNDVSDIAGDGFFTEGDNQAGLGFRLTQQWALAGISLQGLTMSVLGNKFVGFAAFDTVEDANRAAHQPRSSR